MTFDEKGLQAAFHANLDTTDMRVPPFGLVYWKNGFEQGRVIADSSSNILAKNWRVSENKAPQFSKDGKQLYFGIAPSPILQDTAMLEEDIVNVEVWTYDEPRLYTVQELDAKNDKKKSYLSLYDFSNTQ